MQIGTIEYTWGEWLCRLMIWPLWGKKCGNPERKRPDTAGACGSEPCICQANRQHWKRTNKSVLFDFEGIGKGASDLSGHSDQSRCFSRRWGSQSDEDALLQLSVRNAWNPLAPYAGDRERTNRTIREIWNELSRWVKFDCFLTGSFHFRVKRGKQCLC